MKKIEEEQKNTEAPPQPEDVGPLLRSFFDDNPWLEEKLQATLLKRVEEREENKIRIETVLLGKRIRQTVPITPELEIRYQSLLGEEDLAIKERLREAADQLELYFGTLQMFYMMAVMVDAINGVELPGGSKDDAYSWDEIQKRFKQLGKYPIDLLMALSGGLSIFQRRVQGFLSPKRLIEKLKNG